MEENPNSQPFRVASVLDEEVFPLIIEMLITLQASVNATAATLCDIEADTARRNGETYTLETAWEDFQERVREQILQVSFSLSERHPPKSD